MDKRIKVYIITPYHIDAHGCLQPEFPDQCSYAPDGKSCQLSIDHYRDRKTGPCFPLCVVFCATHGIHFTLYPPGHAPHARQRLVPLAPDGSDILTQEQNSSDAHEFFDEAKDAARKKAWPHADTGGGLLPHYSTQLRRLQRDTLLLGIHPESSASNREQAAEILALEGQLLAQNKALIEGSTGYQGLGAAVLNVCAAFKKQGSVLFESLVEAGAIAGLWPFPKFLDHKTLRYSLFHHIGTPPVARAQPP